MRIAVSSFGSEGDARPLIALALGLAAAGHDVVFLASSIHAERAAECKVPFRPVGPPVSLRQYTAKTAPTMARIMAERNPLRASKIASDLSTEQLLLGLPDVIESTREVDLVVHHQFDVCAHAAACVHGTRRVAVHLFHGTLRASRATPDGNDYGPIL